MSYNGNNMLHLLNFSSGILLFLACVYGFMESKENFHFTNLIVNIYTIFASLGTVFVAIAGYREQHPPGILDYFTCHDRQLKFLFLYSWLTVGLSYTSCVLGSLVLVYSFLGYIYLNWYSSNNTSNSNNNTDSVV